MRMDASPVRISHALVGLSFLLLLLLLFFFRISFIIHGCWTACLIVAFFPSAAAT